MRLINKTVAGAVLLSSMSLSAIAQQVPNGGFEGEWETCYPWTSANNTTKNQGEQPKDWTISNVIGTSSGMGKTTVGESATGYNSEKAVLIKNVSAILSQIIPGYITLGTSWSTSVLTSKKDGGTFGGKEFSSYPDGISMMYKFSKGTANATVVAYLWKGNWTQIDVPGEIVALSSPKNATMINRDRCVLGMETSLGGTKTPSTDPKFELIAVINDNATISTTVEDWTEYFAEFEYKSDATPEMHNIIIAAGNYFADPTKPDNLGKNNTLTVDDVHYVYYSRLSSLKVGDKEVALEKDKYDYNVDAEMPADENAFSFVALGKSAKTTVALDKENNKATITVSNDGEDKDGQSSHVYTLAFKAPQEEVVEGDSKKYTGSIVIRLGDEAPSEPIAATVSITPTGENSCKFELPNFALGDTEDSKIGDIVVDNVTTSTENGVTTYNGKVEDMVIGKGSVVGGETGILADVAVTGTTDEEGRIDMVIEVTWYVDATNKDAGTVPIYVTFTGDKTVAIEDICIDNSNAPVEYFNLQGVRVDGENLTPGIYVRRQGNATSKILVK